MVTRRSAFGIFAAALIVPHASALAETSNILVHKDPNCGCCTGWRIVPRLKRPVEIQEDGFWCFTFFGGQILENRQEAERLSEQMQHVEAVIKMLDPSYNVARIAIKRRTANPWFKRGTLYRKALDVLRTATGPMTGADIARAVLAANNVVVSDDVRAILAHAHTA